MDPFTITMTAAGIAQLIAGLLGKKKESPEMKEAYSLLKQRATQGLGAERAAMLASGAAGIARQVAGAQNRGAMALASQGTGRSSQARDMIGDISAGATEAYSNLVARINQLDQEIKQNAIGQLAGVGGAISAERTAQSQAAGSMIGQGLSTLTNPATYGIKSTQQRMVEELLALYIKQAQQGQGATSLSLPTLLPGSAQLFSSMLGMIPPG